MRSTSQSAEANVTNGKTDTDTAQHCAVSFHAFLHCAVSFHVLYTSLFLELALFVAIFQFVGREGRPFMFGRMTTDLGDKSRFPLFYSRGPFLWTIASPEFSRIFQILWIEESWKD